MSLLITAVLGLCLALAAFAAAMLGIGGGVVYTPVQVFFGLDIHQAAATSLVLIMILSIGATSVYHRAGRVDWAVAILLEIFTAAGGFAGGFVSDYIPQRILIVVLTVAVTFSGYLMMQGRAVGDAGKAVKHAWYRWRRTSLGETYELNILLALPISFFAGALAGMVGIGGGIIKVPMMVLLFGIPMDIAVATSGLMVGITAMGGFAGHLAKGHFDWRMALILAPGVFAGAWIGAHTMLRVDRELLKKIFGIAMFLIASGLIVRMILV